jgi:hypothetical protein
MAGWYTFRAPSLCRQVHGELMRSTLLDLASIISATACHQRNYVERYSRCKAKTYDAIAMRTPRMRETLLKASDRNTKPKTNEPTAMLPNSANLSASTSLCHAFSLGFFIVLNYHSQGEVLSALPLPRVASWVATLPYHGHVCACVRCDSLVHRTQVTTHDALRARAFVVFRYKKFPCQSYYSFLSVHMYFHALPFMQ